MARVLLATVALMVAAAVGALVKGEEDGNMMLMDPKKLEMFVDELPCMPKLDGFRVDGAKLLPGSLTVGMFEKTWDVIEEGDVFLMKVHTNENPTDMLTKVVTNNKF